MASLIDHLAILTAYKKRLAWLEEDGNEGTRIDQFYANQFQKEAGGFLYKHLQEVIALIPESQQVELQKEIEEYETSCAEANEQIKKIDENPIGVLLEEIFGKELASKIIPIKI